MRRTVNTSVQNVAGKPRENRSQI